jgi:hypothetical protein
MKIVPVLVGDIQHWLENRKAVSRLLSTILRLIAISTYGRDIRGGVYITGIREKWVVCISTVALKSYGTSTFVNGINVSGCNL